MAADQMTSAHRRYDGKLTSRPLPDDDETIDALDLESRAELATHWTERAASEARVGEAFEVVLGDLRALGASAELTALAARAVDDERRHTDISLLVASRFAGAPVASPPRLALVVPRHEGASPSLVRTLHVVGQCAFNETFASAVLEASLACATGPVAKAALRELLADEVDHARIGWAHLASLDATTKSAVVPWLSGMARANVRMWRDTPRTYPSRPELLGQGALSRELIDAALGVALRELVLPGLAMVGLPSAEIERWVADGAPTS